MMTSFCSAIHVIAPITLIVCLRRCPSSPKDLGYAPNVATAGLATASQSAEMIPKIFGIILQLRENLVSQTDTYVRFVTFAMKTFSMIASAPCASLYTTKTLTMIWCVATPVSGSLY